MTVEERFWSKVNKETESGCWEWTGYRNKAGYGCFGLPRSRGRRTVLAHRFAWELEYGAIPFMDNHLGSALALHKCDNPACCNPSHLFLGSHKDNSDDMRNKGRDNYLKGAAHPLSRFSDAQIAEIRALGASKYPTEIASIYGLTVAHVSAVLNNKIRIDPLYKSSKRSWRAGCSSELTLNDVAEIRRIASFTSNKDMANTFGVSVGVISNVVTNRCFHDPLYTPPNKRVNGRKKGEGHPNSTLTWDQVREIRALGGTATQKELGRRYGVRFTTIGAILRGTAWVE